MKGAHRVIVENKKIKYDFVVRRNLTFITGDSATGKTVMIDMIREHKRYGTDSGVNVSCDCPCVTIDNDDWENTLKSISRSIVFIDEGNKFVVTEKFAKSVKDSDNYFVIATREKLPMLPYSIEEIYGFRKSGKYNEAKKMYTETFHLYGEISNVNGIEPSIVITEDSNSGNEFFAALANEKGIKCVSAKGKSNVVGILDTLVKDYKSILVIVDGAAYGPEMKDTIDYFAINNNGVLYAPESFEWLLLAANVIPNCDVSDILDFPENYIDSSKFMSWERYFTFLITENTKDDRVWQYTKTKLTKIYLSPRVVHAVKKIMKFIKW